jgi:hypothetical protein
VGGVLADEPGLGKTLSMLALLLSGRPRANGKPSLVVSPTPAIAAQWHAEVRGVETHLPVRMRVFVCLFEKGASSSNVGVSHFFPPYVYIAHLWVWPRHFVLAPHISTH